MIRIFLIWSIIIIPLVFIYLIGSEEKEDKKEKMEKEMENEKRTILQMMNDRMFELVNVDVDDKKFIFLYKGDKQERENIICEVNRKHEYKFIFTCKGMVGFLDSGFYDGINSNILFESRISVFTETVNVLKEYYENE